MPVCDRQKRYSSILFCITMLRWRMVDNERWLTFLLGILKAFCRYLLSRASVWFFFHHWMLTQYTSERSRITKIRYQRPRYWCEWLTWKLGDRSPRNCLSILSYTNVNYRWLKRVYCHGSPVTIQLSCRPPLFPHQDYKDVPSSGGDWWSVPLACSVPPSSPLQSLPTPLSARKWWCVSVHFSIWFCVSKSSWSIKMESLSFIENPESSQH